MTKIYFTLLGLFLVLGTAFGQSYITPEEGHKVAYFFSDYDQVQTYDVGNQFFYFSDGDTIYQADPVERIISTRFGKPADYDLFTFPSFLSLSPDDTTIWVGYSDLDNVDARIYSIGIGSGEWNLEARMAANFDLLFWNDSILVSGLNSADYMTSSAVYVLDTSGADQHRKIIETGGSSAGIATDSFGNLYYGTYSFTEPNALYRWDSTQLAAVIESTTAAPLQLTDAVKLTDLPQGAWDCEVDEGDHLVFTMNNWGGTHVLARWNDTAGDGYQYDTLATSTESLGMVKSRGDYTVQVPGNSLFTTGYAHPIADLHTCDYPPILTGPVPVITGFASEALDPIDMSAYVMDLDDRDGFDFQIELMSDPTVASMTIDGEILTGSFGTTGQSNLHLVATSAGSSVTAETVVGTWPEQPEGDLRVSDFGNLILDPETNWNGSDETGQFSSGSARFYNAYNSEYYSWSGWAYSNTSDVNTPGFMNQYSAFTGDGFHGEEAPNHVYGISSLYGPAVIDFVNGEAHVVEGFFVTNSTYAALSMMEGDIFAKKFGGDDGTDPDYFKLLVWGRSDGVNTDSVEFYLADYRFNESENDYLIRTWQWVDLSSLGKVDSLVFGLESSDNGNYGMNTPAYFCIDNLMVSIESTTGTRPEPSSRLILYPNPSFGQFTIELDTEEELDVRVYTIRGSEVYSNRHLLSGQTVDISTQPAGAYIVRVGYGGEAISNIIQKL